MPIPTKFDGEMGEVQDLASGIETQLRVMRHAGSKDVPRMRAALRDALQSFVDKVMATARDE